MPRTRPLRCGPTVSRSTTPCASSTRSAARATTGAWRRRHWTDAPVLDGASVTRKLKGRTYRLYFNGSKLHMVAFESKGAAYWVVNTLLDELSNETMLAIAKGLQPLAPEVDVARWQRSRSESSAPARSASSRGACFAELGPRGRRRATSCPSGSRRSSAGERADLRARARRAASRGTASASASRSTCARRVEAARTSSSSRVGTPPTVLGRRRPLAPCGRSSTSSRELDGAPLARDEEHGAGRHRREGARAARRARPRARRLRLEPGVPRRGHGGRDFMNPDRVVVGAFERRATATRVARALRGSTPDRAHRRRLGRDGQARRRTPSC